MLLPKIEQNALPLSNGKEFTERINRIVSSIAIAHVLVSHKVRLDPDKYEQLLSSLVLWPDPDVKEKTCSSFNTLFSHFPSEQWR